MKTIKEIFASIAITALWTLVAMIGIVTLFSVQVVRSDDTTVKLTITRVRQIDNPDSGSPFAGTGDYYARVSIGGVKLPRTSHRDNKRDVTPNWTFERGAAANSVVPISIRIWDHDSFSDDELCDASPINSKRQLDIFYNLRTGQITGDVTGTRGALINAQGAGESNRVALWFRVTDKSGDEVIPPLPEVWASDLKMKLLWATSTRDTDLATVEGRLRDFNNRLYDATDGQWRIGRFLIHDAKNELEKESKGVGHIHKTDPHGPHGHSDGRPNDPEHFHINLDSPAGTFLMEFLHSWTGLRDEYEKWEDGPSTRCPLDPGVADAADACVMWRTRDPNINELCRPETHNPDTEQGKSRGMDCYSWLAKVMRESGHSAFQVPRVHIPGPTAAPPPHFTYLTIQRVRQVNNPDGFGAGSADIYARVSMDGARFAKSKHRDDRADKSPNWFYGLAYSSNGLRSIPVRIELWDHDSTSDDDKLDINPSGGKRELKLLYNPVTGRISGDAVGLRGQPIHVRGAGDSNKAEIWFAVDHR